MMYNLIVFMFILLILSYRYEQRLVCQVISGKGGMATVSFKAFDIISINISKGEEIT